MLSAAGMYAELVALCNASGRHEQGMELLRRLSQEPEGLSPRARGAAAGEAGLTAWWQRMCEGKQVWDTQCTCCCA